MINTAKTRRHYQRQARLSRKQRLDIMGITLIAAILLAFAGMFYGAYKVDQAHGITVQQSLDNWGF